MDEGTIDNKITAPEGGDTAMPSSSPSSNGNNGSNNSIPIEKKTTMIDVVNGDEEISSQAVEDNEAAAVAVKAIDSSSSSKISPSGNATTTMDTTIESITATAIPIDEKTTTISAPKGEDIPSPSPGQEEEEAIVATATAGTAINSSSSTTTTMETTTVDIATTTASSSAVKTDDADNGDDKPVVDQTAMTEDPTTSTTGDSDMMDVEDAATATTENGTATTSTTTTTTVVKKDIDNEEKPVLVTQKEEEQKAVIDVLPDTTATTTTPVAVVAAFDTMKTEDDDDDVTDTPGKKDESNGDKPIDNSSTEVASTAAAAANNNNNNNNMERAAESPAPPQKIEKDGIIGNDVNDNDNEKLNPKVEKEQQKKEDDERIITGNHDDNNDEEEERKSKVIEKEEQQQQDVAVVEDTEIKQSRYARRPRAAAKAAVEAIKTASTTTPSSTTNKNKKNTKKSSFLERQQEQKDNLQVGRLVEQNKHRVGSSGQFYPHHGRIRKHISQEGRIPSRFVVRWENPIPTEEKPTTTSEEDVEEEQEVSKTVQREDEWIDTDLQEHDAQIMEGRNPFKVYNSRKSEHSRYSQPLKGALEHVRERYHQLIVRDIEHEEIGNQQQKSKGDDDGDHATATEEEEDNDNDNDNDSNSKGGDILSTMILIAALEDALQTSLQYQQQQDLERQQKEGEEEMTTTSTRKKKNRNTTHQHPPLYYSSNPNQYLIAPSREADEEEIRLQLEQLKGPKATVTPAMLSQRIRAGCEWAWTYLQQQQQLQEQHEEEEEVGDQQQQQPQKFLDPPTVEQITATGYELNVVNAKAIELFGTTTDDTLKSSSSYNANVDKGGDDGGGGDGDEQQPQQRRTSIRSTTQLTLFDPTGGDYGESERGTVGGRRSTRRHNVSYAENTPSRVPEPNPVQKGGRIALWWLQLLKQKQQEQERIDAEEEDDDDEEADGDGDVEMKDVAKDNEDDVVSTSAKDEVEKNLEVTMTEGQFDDVDEKEGEEEATKADDDDEDFTMSKDGEHESSEEESLENVEKERAGTLSPIPEQQNDDMEEDEEEEEEEEEEVDEEHAIVWDNPYLQPSFPALLEYFSKPKSVSGEDVQRAMDSVTLRLRKNKRATDYGISIESLESYDRVVLDWENPDHPTKGNLVLKCVSGETIQELQRLDSATYGRCKFELDIIGQKEKTVQIQQKEDFEQRVVEYKTRKFQDKWRFRSIHEGYAVWPSWHDAATKWIRENVATIAAAAATTTDTTATVSGPIAAAEAGTTTSTVVVVAAANGSGSSSINTDEALARSLEESEAGVDAGDGGRARRTGRRSRGASAGKEGVFYGNQSQLTQKQLVDAFVRLVKANTFLTMSGLESMVGDGSSDPLRRCRIALGKIIWKRNLLVRKPVSSDDSDRLLLQTLAAGKKLVKLRSSPAAASTAADITTTTADAQIAVVEETNQPYYMEEEKIPDDANDLLQYISHLHSTELKLRSLVLKQLEVVPLPVIATAADERLGSIENMDATDFEDPSTIDWKSTGHDSIHKLIYRPPVESMMGIGTTSCYWYQIQDYSESIKSEAEDAEEDAMERRMRFRAVPTKGPGGQDEYDGDVLILTESQIHAGMKAGEIQQRQSSSTKSSSSLSTNPYANQTGERITLVPLDDVEEVNEISVRVVGHDFVLDPDDPSDIEYRVLVLPELMNEENNNRQSTTGNININNTKDPFWAVLDVRADNNTLVCQPEGQSIWYSIETQDFHQDSEAFKECEKIVGWLSRLSKAAPFLEPVDPIALGIPTYPDIVKNPMDISTVIEKLENGFYSSIPPGQSKGSSKIARMLNGPFRKDIELIFDNAILFNPPDDWIATAAAALKKSVIKKIATASWSGEKSSKNSSGGRQRSGVTYADEDSDVDMYVDESDYDDEYDNSSSRNRNSNKRKRSNAAKGAKNKDEAAARPLEYPIRLHNCLKDGNDLRGRFSTLPVNSYASTYSMPAGWSCRKSTGTTTTTTPPPTSTETSESDNEKDDDGDNDENSPASQKKQEYIQEMAELLALQKEFGDEEVASLRRSSRATQTSSGRTRSATKKVDSSLKIEGLEYFLRNTSSTTTNTTDAVNGDITANNNNNVKALSSIPSSRLDVEIVREKRHEGYYSKLYQKYEKDLSSYDDNNKEKQKQQFAIYTNSSFPPYLGSVIPSSNNVHGTSWEIRPPFAVPALRWVICGLINSGHLSATEPLTGQNYGESGRSSIDVTAGMIVTNDIYYYEPSSSTSSDNKPFEILDTRVLQRKKRAGDNADGEDDSEDDFEMSEYEKLRAERVARNADRLKSLGLA